MGSACGKRRVQQEEEDDEQQQQLQQQHEEHQQQHGQLEGFIEHLFGFHGDQREVEDEDEPEWGEDPERLQEEEDEDEEEKGEEQQEQQEDLISDCDPVETGSWQLQASESSQPSTEPFECEEPDQPDQQEQQQQSQADTDLAAYTPRAARYATPNFSMGSLLDHQPTHGSISICSLGSLFDEPVDKE